MTRNWSLGSLALLAVVVVVACSPDQVVSGYHTSDKNPKSNQVIDPDEYMTAVGCSRATGPADTGSFAIPMPVGKPAVFKCRNVRHDSVLAAQTRYLQAVAAAAGHPHTLAGYWYYIYGGSTEWCWAQGMYNRATGEFYAWYDKPVWGCFTVDSYDAIWISVNDPDYDQDHAPDEGGPSSGEDMPTPGSTATLTVSPSGASIQVGGTTPAFGLTLTEGSNSTTVAADPTLWSNSSILSWDDGNTFHGVSAGTTTFSATFAGVHSASVTVTVTAPTDTTCKSGSDSIPKLFPTVGGAPSSFTAAKGPLMSLAIQDSLAALPNTSTTQEAGGYIYFNTITHDYNFIRVANSVSLPNICRYSPLGDWPSGMRGDSMIVVAYAHGHPPQGTSLNSTNCPDATPGGAAFGPSDSDRVSADSLAKFTDRNFVVQVSASGANTIFTFGTVIDPSTSSTSRTADGVWTSQGANACYTHQ